VRARACAGNGRKIGTWRWRGHARLGATPAAVSLRSQNCMSFGKRRRVERRQIGTSRFGSGSRRDRSFPNCRYVTQRQSQTSDATGPEPITDSYSRPFHIHLLAHFIFTLVTAVAPPPTVALSERVREAGRVEVASGWPWGGYMVVLNRCVLSASPCWAPSRASKPDAGPKS
jgi:hypothetical protein